MAISPSFFFLPSRLVFPSRPHPGRSDTYFLSLFFWTLWLWVTCTFSLILVYISLLMGTEALSIQPIPAS